jgi:hypothetical protein
LVIIGVDGESRIDPGALEELRSLAQAPLIILDETYNGALETFEAGAEQILPKPFVPDALIGAIKVELRGPSPSSPVPLATRIELGGLVFDAERRVVRRGKTDVRFTKREWEVLSFFLASPFSQRVNPASSGYIRLVRRDAGGACKMVPRMRSARRLGQEVLEGLKGISYGYRHDRSQGSRDDLQ